MAQNFIIGERTYRHMGWILESVPYGRVHSRVTGNTVIPNAKWCALALRSVNEVLYAPLTFFLQNSAYHKGNLQTLDINGVTVFQSTDVVYQIMRHVKRHVLFIFLNTVPVLIVFRIMWLICFWPGSRPRCWVRPRLIDLPAKTKSIA